MITFKGIGDHVIVEELKKKEITEGGIIIPDTANNIESFVRGKVISVGKDITDISEYDIVAFSNHGGQTMLTENKLFRVLKYAEIYCIIKEEKC